MNKIVACCLITTFLFTGCARRVTNEFDVSIAATQKDAYGKCVDSQVKKRPDMTTWTADQINNYENAQALRESNAKFAALAAHEPLDPCAKAGGPNVYDAQMVADKQDTELAGKWLGFGEKILTTALFAYGIHEVAGMLKGMSGGTTITGDNNMLSGVGNKGDSWKTITPTTTTTTTTTTDNSVHLSDTSTFTGSPGSTLPTEITP